METLLMDIRYSLRMLRRNPGFTAVAALTLALGIGANSSIFSLINAVLLRPLPFKDPDGLVFIRERRPSSGAVNLPVGGREFFAWAEQNNVFERMAVYTQGEGFNLTGGGKPEEVNAVRASADYFTVLGVATSAGRTFSPEENHSGDSRVAVLSHGLWQRRFGSDPNVLGRALTLNGKSYTVVGVMPADFALGYEVMPTVGSVQQADVLLPLPLSAARMASQGDENYNIVARLKPGATFEQARTELDLVARRLGQQFPENYPQSRAFSFSARPLLEQVVGDVRPALLVLFGAVAFVLLIACLNVANLQLAETIRRRRELAIRTAIGAGRGRLVRQLLTESVLLALLGGGVGLFFAYWCAQFLLSFIPPRGAPLTLQFDPDARILGFTAAVSLLTGVLFGLAPAWRATRVRLNASLKDKTQNLVGGQTRLGLGKLLIVSQIALSLLLLVGAGLFVRSLQKLRQVETGFNNWDYILLFSIDCYGTAYKGPKLSALHQELLEKMNALPGVRSASLSTATPIRGGVDATRIFISGAAPRSDNEEIKLSVISPRYFETMGMPMLAGRDFSPRDGEQSPKVAVVSESMARHYFPNENPLGRRFSLTKQEAGEEREIIGVVKDAKFDSPRKENTRIVYLSHRQEWPRPSINFALRTAGAPAALIPTVRHTIQSVGKDIPVTRVRTLAAQMDEVLAQERLVATLSGFFGLIALLLACIGLYGLMAYAVTRRTNEIGIRMALGARGADVLRLVMREMLLLVLLGVALGLGAAVAATRLISSLLFGLSATDPATLALAALLLIAVAALAGYLPARRAAGVDPMVALREE